MNVRTSPCGSIATSTAQSGVGLGPTQWGRPVVAGAGLHGAGAVRVTCGQGLGHRRRGLGAGVPGPTQGELQRGALREGLEWRQPL